VDRIGDDIAPVRASDWSGRLTPVQQQLLGGAGDVGGDHARGRDAAATPLYGWLKERGPSIRRTRRCGPDRG
jgi:hypothetical protein